MTLRTALVWSGGGGVALALVLPIAVVEQRNGRQRWRLVPDPTLGVLLLGTALASWIAFGPIRQRGVDSRSRAAGV